MYVSVNPQESFLMAWTKLCTLAMTVLGLLLSGSISASAQNNRDVLKEILKELSTLRNDDLQTLSKRLEALEGYVANSKVESKLDELKSSIDGLSKSIEGSFDASARNSAALIVDGIGKKLDETTGKIETVSLTLAKLTDQLPKGLEAIGNKILNTANGMGGTLGLIKDESVKHSKALAGR